MKGNEFKFSLNCEYRLETLIRLIFSENTPLNLKDASLEDLITFLRQNRTHIFAMGECDQKNTFYICLALDRNLSDHEAALIGKYIQSTHVDRH